MRKSIFRRCLGVVATASVLALAFGPATANAATTGTSPHWYNGHIDQFRAVGSETTFYVMNAINNLYSQSAIFGCALVATDLKTCNTAGDGPDTDIKDNYDRDEFNNGEGIGSTKGLAILCGAPAAAIPADFARSSRPSAGGSCEGGLTFSPYAKDALTAVIFNKEKPVTTGSATTPIGPVSAGWRGDGDALNCNLLSNPGPHFDNGVNGCDGVPFTDVSNAGGVNSIAYRIWCEPGATKISDWGQLTDPTGGATGTGTAIGVPIQIWGVQAGSGTLSVWQAYTGCDSNLKAPDANHVIQENNGPQIRTVETALHPTDPILVENNVQRSLYYGSFGVMNSNTYTKGGGSFSTINGTVVSPATENASLATFRNIYNVYKPSTLKSSVAGFLNWICGVSDADHGVDLTTGKNYNAELTTTIGTKFGFPRLACPLTPTPADLAN